MSFHIQNNLPVHITRNSYGGLPKMKKRFIIYHISVREIGIVVREDEVVV